ncbi:hypothetical protein [Thermococcus sp. MAR1]|uniref:type IV toxin-antitoxin system AbiEi family antitoxin domain-containing protein n=1 Tax=Thermococcus sp. MAR1 TaxID=1638263 RepID=UPI00143A1DA1|nr:hypothetical protein [Thermococcus sp. MAR1]NJE10945.1 hypothetical protein [Thermococcus sp. MAR1]
MEPKIEACRSMFKYLEKQTAYFEEQEYLNAPMVGGRNVSITNPEKTLVDCLDKPQHCGGIIEVMKALRNGSFNRETLLEYAKRMRSVAVLKKPGFLSEKLGLGLEGEIKIPEKSLRSFPLLDPTMPSKDQF